MDIRYNNRCVPILEARRGFILEKLNIYAINLSPCEPDKDIYTQKSIIVRSVIANYKKRCNNSFEIDEANITMTSFCPKESTGYTSYVEEYVEKTAEKPCILIFKNLTDIANVPKTACGRLKNMIHKDGVVAIYFSDYSVADTADTYLNKLIQIFNVDMKKAGKNKRKSLHPESLKKEIRHLRIIEPPVNYSDIAKVTGITQSSLRSIVNPPNTQGKRGPNGRRITDEEKEKLLTLMKEINEDILNSVEIFEEDYIEEKQNRDAKEKNNR